MTTHRRYHLLGNLLHFHRFSSETNGHYCLVETLVAPGAGAPLNTHAEEDEAFVVLEGTFEFVLDGKVVQARAGDTVVIPTGARHAFRNTGSAPGRMMIFNAPGAVHDAFFTTAGDPVPEDSWDFPAGAGEPDFPRIMAAAGAAGVQILPPEQA